MTTTTTDQSASEPTSPAAPTPVPSASESATGMVAARPGLSAETLALGGIFIAVFAFLAAIFAVGLAARAVDEAGSAPAGAGGSGPVTVELMEFMISPDPVTVPAGTTSLAVENTGTAEHTLAVEDGAETPSIAPGESSTLDIGGLAAGTYTLVCTIPGHVEAGMTGTLTVG